MLPACRQLKAQSDDNYILAILIGDIDEANPAQCEAHKALRQSANITLCLPYEQEKGMAARPTPSSQTSVST